MNEILGFDLNCFEDSPLQLVTTLELEVKTLEKSIQKHRSYIEQAAPLVEIGLRIRQRYLEQVVSDIRGRERRSNYVARDVIQAGNEAAHSENMDADIAFFMLSKCSENELGIYQKSFKLIYGRAFARCWSKDEYLKRIEALSVVLGTIRKDPPTGPIECLEPAAKCLEIASSTESLVLFPLAQRKAQVDILEGFLSRFTRNQGQLELTFNDVSEGYLVGARFHSSLVNCSNWSRGWNGNLTSDEITYEPIWTIINSSTLPSRFSLEAHSWPELPACSFPDDEVQSSAGGGWTVADWTSTSQPTTGGYWTAADWASTSQPATAIDTWVSILAERNGQSY